MLKITPKPEKKTNKPLIKTRLKINKSSPKKLKVPGKPTLEKQKNNKKNANKGITEASPPK
jgi:hypothetical protein